MLATCYPQNSIMIIKGVYNGNGISTTDINMCPWLQKNNLGSHTHAI